MVFGIDQGSLDWPLIVDRPSEADKHMRLFTLLLGAALMSACGQMGPLVRPGEDPNRVSHENPVDASEPAAVDATEAETGPSP
ncbi:MAG: hypothetical protein CMP06_14355 [Xanthomonadales bacterium]|jgi:predicted small lipoprotein YifL|nr:hypothetical protein [Xanthomonadales bacterium]